MVSSTGLATTLSTTYINVNGVWASLHGEESRTPTSSWIQGTHATSPDTGTSYNDDASGGSSPRGNERSRGNRSRLEESSASSRVHADLVRKVRHLHEDLAQTQSELEQSQTEVDALREQVNP